jgi:hypothetical protein
MLVEATSLEEPGEECVLRKLCWEVEGASFLDLLETRADFRGVYG